MQSFSRGGSATDAPLPQRAAIARGRVVSRITARTATSPLGSPPLRGTRASRAILSRSKTTGGPAPSSYEELRASVLERHASRHLILNGLTICEAHRNPTMAALASALNDRMAAAFLVRDGRLLTGSVRDDVRDANAAAFYRLAPAGG